MDVRESFQVGLEGLISHKLRSFLTVLGIVFGVSAVIAMLSIGEGARREALQQIELMGIDNILIQSLPEKALEKSQEKASSIVSVGLTYRDARALEEKNPLIAAVVPLRAIAAEFSNKGQKAEGTVIGTTPNYPRVLDFKVERGSFFNYWDLKEARKVCVLGNGIKRDLFLFQDAVGKRIKIGDQWFTVLGVMENKNIITGRAGGLKMRNLNRDVYIPLTSTFYRFHRKPTEGELSWIIARARDPGRIMEAANLIKRTLHERHRGVDDYQIIVPEELMKQRQKTQRIFNIVMGAIASISLLVGGIGIMNIMLASVLERTREIGIRRAVGATRKDILVQFLIEALVLGLSGGVLGVFLGFLMTKLVTLYAGWKTVISIGTILLAFGVSAAVGVIFGIFPARKAALLDPIEALRYE